jgi:hypothetical protein
LLTAVEVAELLNVSKWFVYDHGEELGLVKIGGANRYRRTVLDAFLGAPAETAAAAPRRRPPRRGRRVPLLGTAAAEK